MLLTQSLNNSAAAGLIGKNVRAEGNQVTLTEGTDVELGYFLSQPAEAVTVSIYGADGTLVRSVETSVADAGSNQLVWDGRDLAGNPLSSGDYRFEVVALDGEGQEVPSTTMVSGRVEGVTFEAGSALLVVDENKKLVGALNMHDMLRAGVV